MRHAQLGSDRPIRQTRLPQPAHPSRQGARDFAGAFRSAPLCGQGSRAASAQTPAQQTHIHGRDLEPLRDVDAGETAGLGQLHHDMTPHGHVLGPVQRNRRGADVDDFVVGDVCHIQQRRNGKGHILAGERGLCHARQPIRKPDNIQLNNVTRGVWDPSTGQQLSRTGHSCSRSSETQARKKKIGR